MSEILKFKEMFFTTNKVQALLDRKMAKTLSKFGAVTRTTAQRSMRTRKKPSAAGTPPSSHDKKLLRKLLFFASNGRDGVVVGPVLKSTTKKLGIPRTHEKGGRITKMHKTRGLVINNYPARPYMAPAGNENVGKLPLWYAQQ